MACLDIGDDFNLGEVKGRIRSILIINLMLSSAISPWVRRLHLRELDYRPCRVDVRVLSGLVHMVAAGSGFLVWMVSSATLRYLSYSSHVTLPLSAIHSFSRTAHQVGMLGATRAAVSFFGSPAICALADRTGRHQEVLYAMLGLYTIARPSMLMAGNIFAVAALELSATLFENPINSLVDSAARHSFGAKGYGRQRLWGAVGLGIASLIGGFVYDAGGNSSYRNVTITFLTVSIIVFVAATRVSVGKRAKPDGYQESGGLSKPQSKGHGRNKGYGATQELLTEFGETEDGGGGEASNRMYTDSNGSILTKKINAEMKGYRSSITGSMETETLLAKKGEQGSPPSTVWAAIRTVRTASFFTAVVLSGMGAGVIDTFLFMRLEELAGSRTLLGTSRLVMCLAEVPFFYISGPLIKRMGARGVVALAQVAYLARFIYYSVLTEPWLVIPAETLHGLTFATMWAATIEYAHEIAPDGQQASLVGIVAGLHYGLGVGLGALVGGVLYVALGASMCFRVCTALPSCSLLLLAVPEVHRWIKYGGNRWKEVTGETCL